jgi:beta-lactamase regulating signal transducer with metallopeptidase domain
LVSTVMAADQLQACDVTLVNRVTLARRERRQYAEALARECEMKNGIDPLTIFMALGVAGYVAIMLAYVARVDLELSNQQIRLVSIVAATFIALGIAVDFLGKRLSKAE